MKYKKIFSKIIILNKLNKTALFNLEKIKFNK
jgi:hypothetical protein